MLGSAYSHLRDRASTPLGLFIAAAAILTAAGAAEARCRHASCSPPQAYAQRAYPAHGYPQYGFHQAMRPCFSLDDCDRKAFDESGTRGRMGLGADPAHPEGPGNVSD